MLISSHWSIFRKNSLPFIEITGKVSLETTYVPLNLTEVTMINIAINIIEKANNFNGILCYYDDYPNPQVDYPLAISFSLLFSSEQQLSDFIEMFEKP